MRISLRAKFAGTVLGLVLAMMISIWVMIMRQQSVMEKRISEKQQTAMHAELIKRANTIFSYLAANSEALSIEDYVSVDAFVREMTHSSDIRYIHIVVDGRIAIPMSKDPAPPVYTLPAGIAPAGKEVRFDDYTSPEGEPQVLVSGQIVDKSIHLKVADAYVAISKQPILDAIQNARREVSRVGMSVRNTITFATMIFIALGIASSVGLVTFILRPIRELAAGAKIIGSGDLGHKVDVRSNDEVGDLAKTFNEMTRDLQTAQEKLIESEKLEQELKIATEIQQALLPKELPRVPGYDFGAHYTSAKEVGGDYYDYIPVMVDGRQKIAVVVADVAGKGVPGAVVMSMTRSILRGQVYLAKSPSETLKRTNSVLHADIRAGMFVSMFYGLVDIETGETEFSSAGHNTTLVYRAKTGDLEKIDCKGMALGVVDPATFDPLIETRKIVLLTGDVLFQYTDGVDEAMNPSNEQFGMDRLYDTIKSGGRMSAQALISSIQERLTAFVAGNAPSDDITMVAVKRVA